MTGRPPNNLTSALTMGRAAHLRPIHDLRPRLMRESARPVERLPNWRNDCSCDRTQQVTRLINSPHGIKCDKQRQRAMQITGINYSLFRVHRFCPQPLQNSKLY